ncbi:hypothetical protein [Arthrobacter caoxuetaonis]|uniref:Uncharacterized protein n=1 Tax=Arthrobacter caoxuetaonis TaxID=2886935 RepID=A0A9X1MDF1_9MICC|nr:hypothetical protein [Arthrobacter caoxuetaonis]MCC3297180.1 hypothetical protein [Arthrobacter caoxuetaonis]USQ58260.1 hypothetical protein NF551_05340 [Arthrobacter caoxuetaonis]
MSYRWTVLSTEEPSRRVIVESLLETMPDKSMREAAEGQVIEIVDGERVPVAVELPRLIQVPGEVLRLGKGANVSAPAGSGVPAFFTAEGSGSAQPLWWLDVYATGGAHDGGALADALCHAVARRTNGVVLLPEGAGS